VEKQGRRREHLPPVCGVSRQNPLVFLLKEIAPMTGTESNMMTMKIIKLLGIAGIAILAAAYMAARVQRREEERRRLHNEELERERWESEGGASHSGPATPSTMTAH
jgi:hypothetical protein